MSYNIAVVGAGFLGVYIAGVLGQHGHKIRIHDRNPAQLQQVLPTLQKHKQHLIDEGVLIGNFVELFPGDIMCTDDLKEAVAEADFVIEAIVENLVAKQTLFRDVAQFCQKNCVVSTNSLHFDVNEIGIHLSETLNILGLRFLHPVYYIPEVEITLAKETTPECIQKVQKLIDSIGKVLYFRSGNHPLVLNNQQIQSRKQAYKQMVLSKLQGNIGVVPDMGHGVVHLASNLQQLKENQTPSGQLDCTVCMDRVRDCLLVPCHHMCVCTPCANVLQQEGGVCPICRQPITEIIKVFSP